MATSLVSILLPLHNQGGQIEGIVSDYEEALSQLPLPHELVLIVNGSSDDSARAAKAARERWPNVEVYELQEAGWGRAVRFGLQRARGDLLCYTNSARTTAEDLLRLVRHAVASPGVVIKANRKIRDNWRRRLGSLLFALECRALFDLANWDINGTPKIFPRSFRQLLELTRDDDLIDVEFIALCRRYNYPIVEVPIFSTHRRGGRSTTNYISGLRMYFGAIRFWWALPRDRS